MSGRFVISIDAEFLFGYRLYPNSPVLKQLLERQDRIIDVYHQLIVLFERHRIPVTWAIVGQVALEHPELMERILSSPVGHEIGWHSFSHPQFTKCSSEEAAREVYEGIKIAQKYGISLKSFVYPENKVAHVDVLKKNNFKIYRGANAAGRSVGKGIVVRTSNFVTGKIVAPCVAMKWMDGIWEIPSSMVFYDSIMSSTLVMRAIIGIKKAVKSDSIMHAYLHPEDLLIDHTLLRKIEMVLSYAAGERDIGNLSVVTMGDLALGS